MGVGRSFAQIPTKGRFGKALRHWIHAPRDSEVHRFILLCEVLFLLQGFDVQIPADLCGDLISLCLAPDDVHILA